MGPPSRGFRRMATAPSPPPRTRRQLRRADPPPRWRRWLLLGLFFGLGYGMTQRLLEVRWDGGDHRTPAFRAKSPAGGTPLDDLRRRNGSSSKPLTADLETLARQKRERKDQQEAAKRAESERLKEAGQLEGGTVEERRQRLDDFGTPTEPAAPDAAADRATPSFTPAAPELPSPAPFAAEPPEAPPPALQSRPEEAAPSPP
jgi:hypothetical protein